MRPTLLRFGNSTANWRFKRAPHGWIFRAPTLWILGPRPHYLINEAQKIKIEMVLGASYFVDWLVLAAIASVLFLMTPSILLKTPLVMNNRLLVFILCCLVIYGLHELYDYFALRSVLKSLPRTSEKITLGERLEGPAGHYSIDQLRFLFILFIGLFIGSLFLFAYQALTANAWDVFLSIAGIVASGWAAILFGALLRKKLRSSERI
jgi:hypothetical protein